MSNEADTSIQSQAGSRTPTVSGSKSSPGCSHVDQSSPLSIWVQCTLPLLQVCVRSSQTSITCSLEDLSASVDACGENVDGRYLVGDFSITHQTLG